MINKIALLFIVFAFVACSAKESSDKVSNEKQTPEVKEYAIAIHGGTNGSRELSQEKQTAHLEGLEAALKIGQDILKNGGTSLDAVEQTLRYLEDHIEFNAGKGASLTNQSTHELDAAIMDGRDLSCGAVAGVLTIKNPITLARMVMEKSPHVLFTASGAEKFADQMDVERVENGHFTTEEKKQSLERKLQSYTALEGEELHYGTVGAVALDKFGNLAAATSTGGTTAKAPGRIGDSPIIGAGTYANNKTCAISCTGKGEEFIRNNVAYDISAQIEYGQLSLASAMRSQVTDKLQSKTGGIIGVDSFGNISQQYNTVGMFRGAADSEGLFEVKIWE